MSPFGAYNMAGNVSEWTRNDSTDGFIATGGSWGDPTYTFGQAAGRPGTFSSSKLGFRLVQYGAGACGRPGRGADRRDARRYRSIPVPASRRSTSSPRPINTTSHRSSARIIETTEMPDWIRETITFNGAAERAGDGLPVPAAARGAAAAGAALRAGGGREQRVPIPDRVDGRSHGLVRQVGPGGLRRPSQRLRRPSQKRSRSARSEHR